MQPGVEVDIKVKVTHGDLPRLLRTFKVDYRPAGRIGGLSVGATVTGTASSMTFSGIKGTVGKIPIEGTATLDLSAARPRISAGIGTGAVAIRQFLPVQRTSWAPAPAGQRGPFTRPGLVPAAWRAPASPAANPLLRRTAAAGGRWSSDAIDLSALQAFDAAIKWKAAAIIFDKIRIDDAVVDATLIDGELRAKHLAGTFFDGALAGSAVIRAAPVPSAETALTLRKADLKKALGVLAGKGLASGAVELQLDLTTKGRSTADMVAALDGSGSFAFRNVDAGRAAKGSPLADVLDLVAGFNQLTAVLGGARQGKGLADITGTFKVDDGIARSQDLRLKSNVTTGAATGVADLPKWLIDVNGEIRVVRNPLTDLAARVTRVKTDQALPFSISGPLDAPNITLMPPQPTEKPPEEKGEEAPMPSVDQLLRDKNSRKKVLQNLLNRL